MFFLTKSQHSRQHSLIKKKKNKGKESNMQNPLLLRYDV